MNKVIVHKYAEPNLKKLATNKDANCRNCLIVEKIRLMDGDEGYLCKAALYDIKTLACFTPKEIANGVTIKDREEIDFDYAAED